ncbi:hypothetical protein CASFOL_040611 [Castilleja foliolosa]|uniref:Uncharacterized protein n=1 Tax=Castilleja foliolosa TaxID=1961234 RepID=A0ABD3BDN0_9LAMI
MVPIKSQWLLMLVIFSLFMSSLDYLQVNAVGGEGKGKRKAEDEESSIPRAEDEERRSIPRAHSGPITNKSDPKVIEYAEFAVEAMNSIECMNAEHKKLYFRRVHQGGIQRDGDQINIWFEVECFYRERYMDKPHFRIEMFEIESTGYKQVTEAKLMNPENVIGPGHVRKRKDGRTKPINY